MLIMDGASYYTNKKVIRVCYNKMYYYFDYHFTLYTYFNCLMLYIFSP